MGIWYNTVFIIIIILVIILYIYRDPKVLFEVFLKYISKPISVYDGKYFINNFDKIIEPYFIGNVKKRNNKININRNKKHEYSLLDKSITNGILNELKQTKPRREILDILLKRIIKYIHLDGKAVNFDDLIFVDILTMRGNYFPFFHTDIEWDTFKDSNGFQVWILLEEDEEIKPRGNMFLLETDYIKHANLLKIYKDNDVRITENKCGFFPNKVLKKFNSLKDISPKISYLNAKIGEVFIMNPLLYHTSDPYKIYSKRRAINFRILHKPTNKLKIYSYDNNFSKLVLNQNSIKMGKEYGILNFNNNNNRYKICL